MDAADNINRQKHKTYVGTWLIQLMILAMITYSLINESTMVMTMAAVFTLIYVFVSNASNNMLLLMSITIFENAFKINGILVWIFIIIIMLGKHMIINKKINKVKKGSAFCFIILLLIEAILDALNTGINGETLAGILLVLFFFFLFTSQFQVDLEVKRIILHFGTAYICAMIFLLKQYGGFQEFMTSFVSLSQGSIDYYRFGHSYGETVGGAMAIPIYSLLILSMSLYDLSCEKKKYKLLESFYMVIINIFAFIFGALTVSRSFYLGLIVIVAMFLLARTGSDERLARRKKVLIFCLAVTACIFVKEFQEYILQVINNLFARVVSDTSGGTGERTTIWLAALSYLFNNPIALFFGGGATGYVLVGEKIGEIFSAGMHNLFLDIAMSWGIVGTLCVGVIAGRMVNTKKIVFILKRNTIACIPFVVLFVFSFTAMRTNSMKTYVFFYITIMLMLRWYKNNLEVTNK